MTVHATPPHGESTTPCCDAAPTELPADDRLTLNPDAVTCGCPQCRERTARRAGPCPLHAVHWAGEPGEGPTSLHGNGAASFVRTTGDEDDVTCRLCLTLLTRGSSDQS